MTSRDQVRRSLLLLTLTGGFIWAGCEHPSPFRHKGANPERDHDGYRRDGEYDRYDSRRDRHDSRRDRREMEYHRCPVHREVFQDEPGYCRTCGVRLQRYERR